MKKIQKILLGLAATALVQPLFGQTEAAKPDTTRQYFDRLVASGESADHRELENALYGLLESPQESDWMMARQYFYQLKKGNVVDSLNNVIKEKFPRGAMARNEEVGKFYEESDPEKKEELFKQWIAKFPPSNFGNEEIAYDYARNAISIAYAKAGNVDKAVKYAYEISTPAWMGEGMVPTARILQANGHTKEASQLYRDAIRLVEEFVNKNDPDSRGVKFAAVGLPSYIAAYTDLLTEKDDYQEALVYMEKAYDMAEGERKLSLNGKYANILMNVGRNREALTLLEEAYKKGLANNVMKADLKELFLTERPEGDFQAYIQELDQSLISDIREELSKQLVSEEAPDFTLKDLDGNTVTLSDLKGKVVILDFWATWCGPCKKSFPSMKKAVERFASNPDIKFLFIHTWERDEKATASARQYVDQNDYPFQVLMDLKNDEGNNVVVSDYGVRGIPAKFVIDKEGNIRFRVSGFSGGEDAAVEEIAMMIEMIS